MKSTGFWEMANVTSARVDTISAMPSLQPNTGLSSHEFYSREMYMSLDPADIGWVLDNYRPILARYGYDLLYEIWLDAIEGREQSPEVTHQSLMEAMEATSGVGNWGEYWAAGA